LEYVLKVLKTKGKVFFGLDESLSGTDQQVARYILKVALKKINEEMKSGKGGIMFMATHLLGASDLLEGANNVSFLPQTIEYGFAKNSYRFELKEEASPPFTPYYSPATELGFAASISLGEKLGNKLMKETIEEAYSLWQRNLTDLIRGAF
jgi:hypothetical protein